MTKINIETPLQRKVFFSEILIGDWFYSNQNNVCIKISRDRAFNIKEGKEFHYEHDVCGIVIKDVYIKMDN